MTERYYIYPSSWWPGFFEKSDANHIGFFETLFSYTKLRNFEITMDIHKANVLLEGGLPNKELHQFIPLKNSNRMAVESLTKLPVTDLNIAPQRDADSNINLYKKWKYKFNFIGEPILPDHESYDVCLTSVNRIKNIVDLPLAVMYIHCNDFLPRLLHPPRVTYIPQHFCSFIVSNPKCLIRNEIFYRLNDYKRVNSMGTFKNNTNGNIVYPYWSKEYLHIIGSHKFMICSENTKMETYSTEKIVNPYLARTIPIYWGTHNIKNIFNPDSMLFLEDETESAMQKLIHKIIELDTDDAKYLEFINRPTFTEDNIKFWQENYSFESLGKKINRIINKNK